MVTTFLGLDANGWLAVVGGIYAGATLLLARVTSQASVRATESAKAIARDQNTASAAGIEQQIASAADSVAAQIKASAEQQERQARSTREAALIQARAASVSNNRQGWINALRDEVTGFLSTAQINARMSGTSEPYKGDAMWIPEPGLRILRAHIFKVRLLINPTEGVSTTLVKMLEDALQMGLSSQRREAIVSHTQGILKTEWERVKSGE